MNNYIFLDKQNIPSENEVFKVLDNSSLLWKEILNILYKSDSQIREEWKYYSKKSGWTKKVLKKKRNLFFFTPLEGSFKISFIFGDKAIDQINKIDITPEIKDSLNKAIKYAEGRGVSIEVKDKKDLKDVFSLLETKLNF